jgi:hypothetical protein
MEATKLFFFKECLDQKNESLFPAFVSRKSRIHIEIVSAWLAGVFFPSSFELHKDYDTILLREEAEARITAATRVCLITSASDATAEAFTQQAEDHTTLTPIF